MTGKAHSGQRVLETRTRRLSQWVPWAILGLATAALVLLAKAGPERLIAFFARLGRPQPQGALSLTILHTNDTWGFIYPCG